MKEYNLTEQEKDSWCVPACLQSILEQRGIFLSQEHIAKRLRIDKEGLENMGNLNEFLREHDLELHFMSPFLTIEADLILKERLRDDTDVLVAYDYLKLHNMLRHQSNIGKHVSIVIDYNPSLDQVTLIDPSKKQSTNVHPLPNLTNSIRLVEDPRYGFYCIN